MSSDEVAKETFSFIFRTAKKAPKLFRTIKEAIELINNFSEVQRKNELNNFNKKVNWNEFSYSEKNAADLNILKEAMKNSSVDYSIFKGKEHIDGTADYILKFSAKDLDAIKKALKEFSRKFKVVQC